jgi:hypothetical protein
MEVWLTERRGQNIENHQKYLCGYAPEFNEKFYSHPAKQKKAKKNSIAELAINQI